MSKDKQITRAQPHHKFTGSGEDGGALPVQEEIVSKKRAVRVFYTHGSNDFTWHS